MASLPSIAFTISKRFSSTTCLILDQASEATLARSSQCVANNTPAATTVPIARITAAITRPIGVNAITNPPAAITTTLKAVAIAKITGIRNPTKVIILPNMNNIGPAITTRPTIARVRPLAVGVSSENAVTQSLIAGISDSIITPVTEATRGRSSEPIVIITSSSWVFNIRNRLTGLSIVLAKSP